MQDINYRFVVFFWSSFAGVGIVGLGKARMYTQGSSVHIGLRVYTYGSSVHSVPA